MLLRRIIFYPTCGAYKNKKNTLIQRPYSSAPKGMKVTICGAAGCTGQPLALMLKQCPLIDEIALYDIIPTCGYGMELSHVDTKCKISSFSGQHMLCDALKDSSVVVIVARNECDSFENNAPVLSEITLQICNICPDTFTLVATEPVESMVPLVSEIQRLRNVYNPRKLLGCVELNCVRANTALAQLLGVPPEKVRVPVIGGATPQTMVPVLSAAVHPCTMTQEQIECVTSSIMCGREAVSQAKGCNTASACLSGAYAIARNTINVVKGLKGGKVVVQCAYMDSRNSCAPDCQFFAADVLLGSTGVEKRFGIPELSRFENCLLYNCLPSVRNEIERAVQLVFNMCKCGSTPSGPQPGSCYTPPAVPCEPSMSWASGYPDKERDKYLASICRQMTCKCGSTALCWKPREENYQSSKLENQMPYKGPVCSAQCAPKSIRLERSTRNKGNTCFNAKKTIH